jgi:hypothetical protein
MIQNEERMPGSRSFLEQFFYSCVRKERKKLSPCLLTICRWCRSF